MTVTATNIYIFQTLKLQSPGLVLTKISRILELDTDAIRSGWMCILNFDVIGSFSFIYCSLKIIKKDIKILSPENIYVQLFRIEPPNVKPIGHPNRFLTIR